MEQASRGGERSRRSSLDSGWTSDWLDESGSGTLLGAALIGVASLSLVLTVAVYGATATKARVQAAADMAALAATQSVLEGSGHAEACDVAGQVARRSGFVMSDCADEGPYRIRVGIRGSARIEAFGIGSRPVRAEATADCPRLARGGERSSSC